MPRSSKKRVALFGGGRWARVLLGVCLKIPKHNLVFSVHTKHCAGDMKRWVTQNGYEDRVEVTTAPPDLLGLNYIAAIVANAADGHKKSAEMAIGAKIPVLVEKPMTNSYADTCSLIQSAKNKGTCLSSSLVFMHAQYIDNFINSLPKAGRISKIYFD